MNYSVKIREKEFLTHNVIRLVLEKPKDFHFTAGQAIELSIKEPAFSEKWTPFTFTGLETQPYLELMLKIYPENKGMTLAISKKAPGDTLIITEPWDSFKFTGPGTFIAGGTGITPFVAILRYLKASGDIADSQLFFSNKTKKDVFLEEEFRQILGGRYINVLTREPSNPSAFGKINEAFLKEHIMHFNQPFYICGPEAFCAQIRSCLITLGAKKELVDLSL